MPVTKGTYAENERKIYYQLVGSGLNSAAACGILANLQAESGFNPKNLQNSYESSLGYTDKSYTDAVDSGRYTNFVYDKAGYGIAQWTFWSRKKEFLSYAKTTKKKSIGDLATQIEFLLKELKRDYKSLWNKLSTIENSAQGAYDAGYYFCKDFERPASSNAPSIRGGIARDDYWRVYATEPTTVTPVSNIGSKIVEEAITQIEKIHDKDGSSLVHYSYNAAGVSVPDTTAKNYYDSYKNNSKQVRLEDVAPGDILFYKDNIGNMRMSIYAGDRSVITVDQSTSKVVKSYSVGTPSIILRILSDAQVGVYEDTTDTGSAIDYESVSIIDPYTSIIGENLSRVEATGYDYGYLFDISHSTGGSFRFYVPEFTEHAGANWSNVEIRGRSVDILSYEYTNSRVITVNLDLYAGAGLYAGLEGESLEDSVDRLHRDLNFLKSLEYPDYSDVIVRPPATVHLILGSSVDIIGVVSEVSIEHLKPLDRYNRAVYVKVSFTVTQIATNPPDYNDIREGAYAIAGTSNVDSIYSGGSIGTSRKNVSNAPVYSNKVAMDR